MKKVYFSIRTLRESGLSIPQELLDDVSQLEQEFITDKIISAIQEAVVPLVQNIQTEFKLIIHHKPGEQLEVMQERLTDEPSSTMKSYEEEKGSIKELEYKPEKESAAKTKSQREKNYNIANPSRLMVFFADGTEIRERYAAHTFSKTIEKIGGGRVMELGLRIGGARLVSTANDAHRQFPIAGGYFVGTHSSTQVKKDLLEEIALKLGEDLVVHII